MCWMWADWTQIEFLCWFVYNTKYTPLRFILIIILLMFTVVVVVNYYFAILMMTQNGSIVVELSLLIWTQLFGLLVAVAVVVQFVAVAAPLFSSLSYIVRVVWVTKVICAKKTTTKTPDETLSSSISAVYVSFFKRK